MIVHVHPDSSIRLDDPDDFKAFSVRAPGLDVARVVAAFGPDAQVADEGHVWISIARLHALGAAHGGPDWRQGCDEMLAYAATRGWIDEPRNLVRAHLDT